MPWELCRSSVIFSSYMISWQDAYRAAGLVLRDRLLESLNDTNAYYREMDVKRLVGTIHIHLANWKIMFIQHIQLFINGFESLTAA